MSLKATIFFSLWTSFFCALFNGIYMLIPVLGGHPWIMFVCLAVFFALNSTPKDVPNMMVSASSALSMRFNKLPLRQSLPSSS